MNIKFWLRGKKQRNIERLELYIKALDDQTSHIPGATLDERIINMLASYPTLQPKTPPVPMQTIEPVTAAGY